MPDTIRQQIMGKVDARFKTISTIETYNSIHQLIINAADIRFKTILIAGGYKMNLGENVFAWRTTPIQQSELPALVYWDRTETKEVVTFGFSLREIVLDIEIYGSTPAEIRECLADLETAVFSDDTWGGLAMSTKLDTNEIKREQKEDIFVASKIHMVVGYLTLKNDPYTQP